MSKGKIKLLDDASVAFLLMLTQPRKHQVYLMRWVKFETAIFCFNMNALDFKFVVSCLIKQFMERALVSYSFKL